MEETSDKDLPSTTESDKDLPSTTESDNKSSTSNTCENEEIKEKEEISVDKLQIEDTSLNDQKHCQETALNENQSLNLPDFNEDEQINEAEDKNEKVEDKNKEQNESEMIEKVDEENIENEIEEIIEKDEEKNDDNLEEKSNENIIIEKDDEIKESEDNDKIIKDKNEEDLDEKVKPTESEINAENNENEPNNVDMINEESLSNLENDQVNEEKDVNVKETENDSPISETNYGEENESKDSPQNYNDQIPEEHINDENSKDDMPDNIINIEEIDAHVSISKTNQEDEEDVLSDDRTQTAEKQKSPAPAQMDIDNDDSVNKIGTNEDTLDDASKNSDVQDVEMRSVESSDATEKEKSLELSEKSLQLNMNDEFEQQFEISRKSTDVEPMESEISNYDKDNESQDNDREESAADNLEENNDEPDSIHDSTSQTDQLDTTEVENEITETHTENIQEEAQGESADIVLIPDNDEELTGAEKEQAILARQNAEKENAEKEQAEIEDIENTIPSEQETQEQDEPEENCNDIVVEQDINIDIEKNTENESKTKTIIVSIIQSNQKCVECDEHKNCGYRFKNESGHNSFICNQECCDSLINKDKTKFLIRKRKYIVEDSIENKDVTCVRCKEIKQCKYTFKEDDENLYICNDNCFDDLSKQEPEKLKLKRNSIRVKNLVLTGSSVTVSEITSSEPQKESKIVVRTAEEAEIAKLDRDSTFERRCANCSNTIHCTLANLTWEVLEFCNQICLSKYQHSVGHKCRTCQGSVSQASLGKYCVRFGFEICQFCCAACLDKYKKSLKNCSYCQKDISKTSEGFLASVGDNEQFKDFCSQTCMKKYDSLINPKKSTKNDQCSVCNIKRAVQVELLLDGRTISFCSHPCFSAFKFVNNIIPDKCNLCLNYFERKSNQNFTIYTDNVANIFCGKICMNIYIAQNRKIVFCQWCKVKKYNFDMIKKRMNANEEVTMCSLNCLVLYGVSLNRITKQKIKCDSCMEEKTPQYHLTMSDSSMRNFCTYQCVMQFQSQFSSTPLTLDNANNREIVLNQLQDTISNTSPFPTGLPKRIKSNQTSVQTLKVPLTSTQSSGPIITNITSWADSASKKQRIKNRPKPNIEPAFNAPVVQLNQNSLQTMPLINSVPKPKIQKKTVGTTTMEPANKTFVVELPPESKSKHNMITQCMPLTETIGVSCKPESRDSEIQTDSNLRTKKIIPVPIPFYIPQPMRGYPIPRPIPIPFMFPIPIPIFIPTTKNSAEGIMKEIKKIQDKMPADPYEAELLMMAELVASDKKKEDSDNENNEGDYNNDNSYGEDVLQMALKMATEYDEPQTDLNSSITPNNDNPNLIYHQMQNNQRSGRGRKRISPTNARENNIQSSKKRRTSENQVSPSQTLPVEKPDANMCLKYTFGVNAWKQWVITKNTELEKSSIRRKPFKSELLQMTADELNYSLCLFVKEVRKPNGTEYAPDTIYYLVLGIQQYLYENGRIDNIFTDPYYERFTDCLDEVARKFSVLYNDSQYIVTRVEEEHLWECKQLGAHSPHVLLSTLMFFNTKHFNLTTVEEHMQLSFSHIMKHWKRNSQGAKQPGSRNVLLRFYPPNSGHADSKKKKVYEQQENEANPLRCPVRLYEFYLSKCPESVKTRNDVFYLQPERSCVPDSPVWYSTQPLSQESLQKMLHRVKMVKEINVALLTI